MGKKGRKLGSCFISRAAKTENPVPRSFFAPKPNGNACYAGYNYKCLVSRSVSRYIVHMLHRFSLQSARSRCHVKRHLAVLAFGFSPFRERNNFIRLS